MSACFDKFCQLDALLTQEKAYWQFMPFACQDYPWRHSNPELSTWLDALSELDLALLLEDSAALVRELAVFLPVLPEMHQLADIPALAPVSDVSPRLPRGLDVGIPGRKWLQILAFNAVLPSHQLPWLEWCAGKGYLGRVLAACHHTEVTSLEWQQRLTQDGQLAANQLGLPMTFIQADAFAPESARVIKPDQHAVALHACGDLHVSLLEQVAAKRTAAVSVSPCCYHLIRHEVYQPLSKPAKASELRLSKHDLRMPLQETVTAGQRVKQQRFVEVSYRLGFDALQKHLTGNHEYLPVPNVQKARLKHGFTDFCQWAAAQKGLPLTGDIDYLHWQQQGEARFREVERMELVRQAFRRPLEMWLVFDRALLMQEAGYQVSVGTFCDKPTTPRNIMIHAQLEK
ncbi:methyltransferase [Photobacterium halotolerans]|uniref:SAM-dependent methyltransferase n=1 Tax=Photobacterium halotolerans TaxID=265726 RepID=A0A0F5VEX3_9GAMM|nr:methyltransferase [Photobacterium halotolerans]KKD00608.1 SAM-dependent methyltransferase [Photobacterium halotolerans]